MDERLNDLSTYLWVIKTLRKEVDVNNTLPEAAKLGMNYACDYVFDMFMSTAVDIYNETKHSELRYNFEEELMDTGRYNRINISEVDDGWDEFLIRSFIEEFGLDVNDTLEKRIKRANVFLNDFISQNNNRWSD